MITDHLPALEYVLRDKAARGEKIKAALLLIDIDTFGKLPATNVNIDSFLPPELSGEHPARFWWRYLTVFQLRMWRGIIAYRMRGGDRADKSSELVLPPRAPIGIPSRVGDAPAAHDTCGCYRSRRAAAAGRDAAEPRRASPHGLPICGAVPDQRHRADGCDHPDACGRGVVA